MKNLFCNTVNDAPTLNAEKDLHSRESGALTDNSRKEGLLKPGIVFQMATGQIPDLMDVCFEMADILNRTDKLFSALQFVPVMQRLHSLEAEQAKRFIKNPESRHVLISNDLFDLVLIHWKPGKASDIHGHSDGGCLFKLLQGKLEELRYTPEQSPKLLATTSLRSGSMAYIDDSLAYHQVGNPYGTSAISLHVYVKCILNKNIKGSIINH